MMRPRLLAALIVIVLSAACGPKSTSTQRPPTTPSASSSPTSASPSTPGSVVRFGKEGVVVKTAADASKLAGTSDDFKAFIVSQAGKLKRPAGATDCFVGITVDVYDPAGFAQGAVNECGGYVALWGKTDGQWKELIGTQDAWMCAELVKKHVPSTVVSECVAEGGDVVPYRDPVNGRAAH